MEIHRDPSKVTGPQWSLNVRTWTISDADGRNSRVVTLAEYIVAIERAAAHGVKPRLYTLQAAPVVAGVRLGLSAADVIAFRAER